MSEIANKIIHIEEEMATAFNLKDIDKMLTYIDNGFTGFSSTTHSRIRGIDAFKKTIEYYLDEASKVKYKIYAVEVQELGDSAIATFYWTVKINHDSHIYEIQGRGTHVYQINSDNYKIVHEHYSRAHFR
ncbi:MAG: nuclear transport factor 2 family protein [Candidatus Marinimicrobia bacterium]|nr:nuclear transport factor 2 family protein [Candidatus Neomarinimicrobiota bacterium]